ncbi:MAG: aminopeptidase P family protein [Burkholderiales bacterium]|nr:aminopeptidase P family protein [Burkholderiales bacterium]
MDQANHPIPVRLDLLRQAMRRHGLDAYIVPSSDPHMSEYLPGRWQARRWLSGFRGSVATLAVTADFAGLWVDSRYWQQAETELAGSGIELMRVQSAGGTQHVDYLADTLKPGQTVGVDGQVIALASGRGIEAALAARGIGFKTGIDLLTEVWADRPALPTAPIFEHLPPYATVPRADKLAHVRSEMAKAGADWHWISTLDDLAWVFNLRGADVNYNPIFLGHALIGRDSATLFVAPGKAPAEVVDSLKADGISLADYSDIGTRLAQLPAGSTLLVDPRRVALGLFQQIAAGVKVVEAINPSTFAKSMKRDDEAQHVRATMEQDGAALAEFFCWLEGALGKERITELTIDEQITAARARRPGFITPSFGTIAGFNANGALPHYHATPESHAEIEGNGLLLIDSGGQYLGGTTDITRVVAIGTPSAEQKRDFTLVLKGMIALTQAKFPRGTRSPLLDSIARAPIWADGINFGHGTGHGVGYFLNVHEGPQSISPSTPPDAHTAMEPGMITSNEPGIYRPGRWGVRIENLLLNVPAGTTEFGEFLAFETLTLCPIDTRCVDRSILREDEVTWLNDYHAMCRKRIAPLVSGDALAWLEMRTAAI